MFVTFCLAALLRVETADFPNRFRSGLFLRPRRWIIMGRLESPIGAGGGGGVQQCRSTAVPKYNSAEVQQCRSTTVPKYNSAETEENKFNRLTSNVNFMAVLYFVTAILLHKVHFWQSCTSAL